MIGDKNNDSISFRVPDETKRIFDMLVKAEGKSISQVLTAYIDRYIREREEYIASIASEFGYTKTDHKEKPRKTLLSRVGQDDE